MNNLNPLNTKALTRRQQFAIAAVLLVAMILTRSQLLTQLLSHVQDASWAIFFMVGFYLRDRRAFPLFFLSAFVIDLLVIDAQGGQHYCFTPSYPFLIPAYAAIWYAGKWFATRMNTSPSPLSLSLSLIVSVVAGTAACFTISNAGFYWFSGKFAEMSTMQYVSSIAHYLPAYLQTTVVYIAMAGLIHTIILQAHKLAGQNQNQNT